MGERTKQEEVHDHFYNLIAAQSESYFFDDPAFNDMTIKQAKEKSASLATWIIRTAMDYHNSMSVALGADTKGDRPMGDR